MSICTSSLIIQTACAYWFKCRPLRCSYLPCVTWNAPSCLTCRRTLRKSEYYAIIRSKTSIGVSEDHMIALLQFILFPILSSTFNSELTTFKEVS